MASLKETIPSNVGNNVKADLQETGHEDAHWIRIVSDGGV
jgi:hypothetical protein